MGDGSASVQQGVCVVDDGSFGVYPFPFGSVFVDSAALAGPAPGRTAHFGDIAGEKFRVGADKPVPALRDVRIRPNEEKGGVLSWITCAPFSATGWLLEALPTFWLSRHRLTRDDAASLKTGGLLDLGRRAKQRAEIRGRLAHHANSLKCKLWALRYHRKNFRDALRACNEIPGERTLHLIRANAEFQAHDNCCYAMLDEMARVLALLTHVRTGHGTPESFHDLHSRRSKQVPELSAALARATWYEAFRLRRANATHAHMAYAAFSSETSEVLLWQHPDTRIFSVPGLHLDGANAATVFADLCRSFDQLTFDMGAYMLGLFHDFDVVTIHLREPSETTAKKVTVWTRRIFFSESHATEDDGQVLLDAEGRVEVWSDKTGTVEKGPPGTSR